MLDVLEPLEVADSDTAAVAEHVGEEADALLEQDGLALGGGGAVGSLHDQLALEIVGVVDVDRLLEGGRDEDIAKLDSLYHSE